MSPETEPNQPAKELPPHADGHGQESTTDPGGQVPAPATDTTIWGVMAALGDEEFLKKELSRHLEHDRKMQLKQHKLQDKQVTNAYRKARHPLLAVIVGTIGGVFVGVSSLLLSTWLAFHGRQAGALGVGLASVILSGGGIGLYAYRQALARQDKKPPAKKRQPPRRRT